MVFHNSMAVTTAFVNFSRTLGGVFGLAIAGTLFNNRLISGLMTLNLSPEIVQSAANDVKYVNSLTGTEHEEIIQKYVDALKLCFIIMVPFGGMSFLCSLGIQHYALRKSLGETKAPDEKQNAVGQDAEQPAPDTPASGNYVNPDLEKGRSEAVERQ
jgi:hypothetical protein